MEIIKLKNLSKYYKMGTTKVDALKNINLTISSGEFVAVMGPSGSGKSTLMNLIGCLDKPSKGQYILDNTIVNQMSSDELAEIRNKKIGFVFQNFNLLSRTTAIENVQIPLIYGNTNLENRELKAKKNYILLV